ncbi:MAG: putative porin [Limisphaerales bacterium]
MKTLKPGLCSMAVLLTATTIALAQSNEALLHKLVEKGILTTEEAKQLRAETDRDFTAAHRSKTGMPEWVTSLQFSGDLRVRFNSDQFANAAGVTRDRWRYRARFGWLATMRDHFEVGLRFGSGDLDSPLGPGGGALSYYQTLQNNASKKGVFLDQAFGRWTALRTDEWKLALTAGKMPEPFEFFETGLGFDPDYTPEGLAWNVEFKPSTRHTLRWVNAFLVLDELAAATDDPFLLGSQLRLDSQWSKQWSTSLGLLWLGFENTDRLSNGAVPNANVGNWRVIPSGTNALDAVPQYDFAPLMVDAAVTYQFARGPLHPGPFPVRVSGAYQHNPEAPASAHNYAWSAGLFLGKAGRAGTWELAYCYKWIGANAVWEEVIDDDFGGYWASTAGRNFASSARGFFTGTNARGHVTRLSYSPRDFLTLSLRWYHMGLIDEPLAGPGVDTDSTVDRFMVEADLRF